MGARACLVPANILGIMYVEDDSGMVLTVVGPSKNNFFNFFQYYSLVCQSGDGACQSGDGDYVNI